jgi:hypothetical protein
MDAPSLNVGKFWLAASLAASCLLLFVPLAYPSAHAWPFILLDWLTFVAGGLLLRRSAVSLRAFQLALFAFAAAGLVSLLAPTWP